MKYQIQEDVGGVSVLLGGEKKSLEFIREKERAWRFGKSMSRLRGFLRPGPSEYSRRHECDASLRSVEESKWHACWETAALVNPKPSHGHNLSWENPPQHCAPSGSRQWLRSGAVQGCAALASAPLVRREDFRAWGQLWGRQPASVRIFPKLIT